MLNAILIGALGTIIVAIIAGILAAPAIERALLYHPAGHRIPPTSTGLTGVTEHVMKAPGGEQIIAWHAPAAPGQPTLLYFHGNGGNLAARAERIYAYAARGRGVFMMSYRSYSGSTGLPSERANVADAKRAFDTLVALGTSPDDIFVYGESLGTGVAVQVAIEKPAAGVILDSPYTSITDLAAVHYPFLATRLMMRDRYETMRYLDKLKVPVLIIHGERDQVVPVEMGRAVANKAPGPVTFVIIPDAGHNDHAAYGSFDTINEWIDEQRAGTQNNKRRADRAP